MSGPAWNPKASSLTPRRMAATDVLRALVRKEAQARGLAASPLLAPPSAVWQPAGEVKSS